ncbi:hypothetical protein CSA37_03720 [Candidatus Fermentibacteria bacterium]|nr:MAG: hypothetical protein CSA37_03720 [Candidatus Fermentibacteria bacterium]
MLRMVQREGAYLKLQNKHLKTILRILLFLLTAFAVYTIQKNGSDWLEQAREYQWSPNPLMLSISGVLLSFSLVFTPLGWALISRNMGSNASMKELFAAWYASQLGRYIPGKIWLFAGRAGFLKARGMGTARAAATTALELLFTVASVGLITVTVSLFFPEAMPEAGFRTAAALSGSAALLLPLLHPVQRYLCRKKGIEGDFLPGPAITAKTVLLFTGFWIMRGFALFTLLKGAGIEGIKPAASLLAAPLSWFAGYIAVMVPGGIGIRETAAAAISAPAAVVPAAFLIAGQRVFMALLEAALAAWGAGRITIRKKEQ